MELQRSDLNHVVRRIPADIAALMRAHCGKLLIAGGFVRAVIAGEEVNDIDLWSSDGDWLEKLANVLLAQRLAAGERSRLHKTDNALTLLTDGRATVQFITRWTFEGASQLVASFDFTIVQAAVWFSYDAQMFASEIGERFYIDLAARRLFYTAPIRVEEAGGSLLRVLKYVRKGYNIQIESLAAVVARLGSALKLDQIEGGLTNEYQVARVLHGLLREVDPSLVVDGLNVLDDHGVS